MASTNTTPINDYILRSRYLNNNESTYDQVCERVCSTVAPNDSFLLQQMKDRKWCPGGRTLAYVGTSQPVSANCLVLPLTGSINESDDRVIIDSTPIVDTLCRALVLQKHGMGIGFSFSKIPQHCIYDKRLQPVGGSFKRLLMLHISHPDIASFIDTDYRSFKKVIIVPDSLLENPSGSFNIRRVNYDHKCSMQYPEILSESTINAIDLLNLIRKSDCTIRSESSIYESSHYYRVHDTLDSIVDVLRQIAKRTQNGEDYAIDLSRLRKAGSICDHDVKSGGPVSFAFIYDVVVNAIKRNIMVICL